MLASLSFLPLLGPLALVALCIAALNTKASRPLSITTAAQIITWSMVGLAGFAAMLVMVNGSMTTPLIGMAGIGISLRLDPLSITMALLVSFIGAIVVGYSRNYLDGDPRQAQFFGWMSLTLASVLTLVMSGNLVLLFAAWLGTSVSLHQLLVFYPERAQAQSAAWKKFLTARLGDGALAIALIILAASFGTTDIAGITSAVQQAETLGMGITVAAVLIAITALLKSAQFPTHGWLTQVMETPTPVSALLHAGIVNAGGFLVIRFADVILMSDAAMVLLAMVGGFTALFGALVMLTQTRIKVALAYSTVAQMGFMLLQCGLGAFPAALLHIVAHSLYKAHAFLSSGSVVDQAKALPSHTLPPAAHPGLVSIALMGAVTVVVSIGWLMGFTAAEKPAIVALGAILALGLAHYISKVTATDTQAAVMGKTLAASTGLAVLYFSLQWSTEWLMAGTVPAASQASTLAISAMILAVVSFFVVTVIQLVGLHRAGSPIMRAAYVHLRNGLYADLWLTRLTGTKPSHVEQSPATA